MPINVDTNAVQYAADRIDQYRNSFLENLKNVEQTVQYVQRSWDSPAGDAFVDKFSRFDRQANESSVQLFNSYSSFLRRAAGDGYETLENEINTNATKFI